MSSFDSILRSFERIVGQKLPEELIKSGVVKILPSSYKGLLYYIYPVLLIGTQLKDCDEFLAENKIQLFQRQYGWAASIDETKPVSLLDSSLIHDALVCAFNVSKKSVPFSSPPDPNGLKFHESYLLDHRVVEKEIQFFRTLPNSRFIGFMNASDLVLMTLRSGKQYQLGQIYCEDPSPVIRDSIWEIRPKIRSSGLQVFNYRFDINIQKSDSNDSK